MVIKIKNPILVIIFVIVIFGATVGWMYYNTSKSESIHVFSLTKLSDDVNFYGELNVPEDISLESGEYTFFVHVLGTPITSFYVQSIYTLNFIGPEDSCNVSMSLSETEKEKIPSTTFFSECYFLGKNGKYIFNLTQNFHNPLGRFISVDIDLRKMK